MSTILLITLLVGAVFILGVLAGAWLAASLAEDGE